MYEQLIDIGEEIRGPREAARTQAIAAARHASSNQKGLNPA
jgi:hypothetical protein